MPFAVQAYVPRRAFESLDFPAIMRLAKEAGVPSPRVEQSNYRVPHSTTRVTCSVDMAVALVEAFRLLTAQAERKQDGDLLVQCASAIAALFKAIDEARKTD